MVYLENIKTDNGFIIEIEVATPGREEVLQHTLSKEDILGKDIEDIKIEIKSRLPRLTAKDKCRIINHIVASINDFKRKLKYE